MFIARIGTLLPYAHMYTHGKFELDGVNWDFEVIIRIKRLEIGCDEAKGERRRRRGAGRDGRQRARRRGRKEGMEKRKLDDAGEEN